MMKARELYPGIYSREIPLKGNPLKSINIYMVKTEEKTMIVDTGFHTEEIIREMEDYLRELNVDLSRTFLFLTHLHSDHTGLASWFDRQNVPVVMGRVDGEMVERMRFKEGPHWQGMIARAHAQGMDPDHLDIEDHPGFRFRPKEPFSYTPVDPGDELTVGEFTFTVIDEAGHTPGMVGLYEKEKKILFCGDHLLAKITPNITYWGEEYGDSLGTYLKNIQSLKSLPIDHLFSSHRELITDVSERVDQLTEHHHRRLEESRLILKKLGRATVRDVTVNLNWDIRAKNWEDFPKSQKWFAAGEGHAHLEYLREIGEVAREDEDGILYYRFLEN